MQEHFSPEDNPKLEKVDVNQIELGMYMSHPDRPWLETSFMFQGFVLDSDDLINQVRKECDSIYVDREKSREVKSTSLRTHRVTKRYPIKRPVEQEIQNANKHHGDALQEVRNILKQVRHSDGINVTNIRKSVKSCVVSIMDNPNAMLWLGKLRNRDDYTAEHSLNVGILAIALGRHMGLDAEQLETLGLCGMLHDVGKLQIDPDILNKPGRLTDEEFDIVKTHCGLGREILEQDQRIPKEAAIAAYSHHERFDGKGYPAGIEAGSLNLFTRMISIVDAYDAITTNRCYDQSRPATEAIKILFSGRNIQFDGGLVEQFIECLGIYPTGSLVELHSGETAMVVDSNKTSRLHPKVAVILDENKKNQLPVIVDTLAYEGQSGNRTIKRILDENDFSIDLDAVFKHFGV